MATQGEVDKIISKCVEMLNSNKVKDAVKYLKPFVKKDENNARLIGFYGFVLIFSGEAEQGFLILQKSIEMDPQISQNWGNQMSMYLKYRQYEKAKISGKQAVEALPNNSHVWYKYSEVLFTTGSIDSAIDAVKKSIVIDSKNYEAWLYYGFILWNLDRKMAINAFRKAIEIQPKKLAVWQLYANQLFSLKEFSHKEFLERIYALINIVELEPTNSRAWFNLGNDLKGIKDYNNARIAYSKLINLNVDISQLGMMQLNEISGRDSSISFYGQYTDLARDNIREGDYDEAIYICDILLTRFPAHNELKLIKGKAYSAKGEKEIALKIFEEMLGSNLNNSEFLEAYGVALKEKGENDKAYEYLLKSFQIDPKGSTAWFDVAHILYDKGQVQDAIKTCVEAINNDMENIDLVHNFGLLLIEKSKFNNVKTLGENITRNNPKSIEGWDLLAQASDGLEQFQDMVRYRKKILELMPNESISLKLLGEAYKKNQEYEESIKAYEKVLAIDPNDEEAKADLKLVRTILRENEKSQKRERENQAINKLKKILLVSNKIRLEIVRDTLQLDNRIFSEKIIDWAFQFGFRIDGDYIITENANIDGFIDDLNKYFQEWEDKSKEKSQKI